jgi:hypothetical protein
METQIIKTPREIQRAHDILISVLLGDAVGYDALEGDQLLDVVAYASVFCWLLGHTHNSIFAQNLAMLEERLRQAGYVLTDAGTLHRRPEGMLQ